jgi:Flp pilus assembly protein TadG
MSTLRRFFRERDDERGQSIVEFALLLPVMLLIITGLFDVARAVWEENTLAYSAREGTRYAIVHGAWGDTTVWPGSSGATSCTSGTTQPQNSNCTPVYNVVRNSAIGVPNVTVTVTWRDVQSGSVCYDRGCHVSVDATAPFIPLPSQYLIGGAFQITLRGGSELVIER